MFGAPDRNWLTAALRTSLATKQLIWLHGPRGSGKSTLIRQLASATQAIDYVDCETPGRFPLGIDAEAFVRGLKHRVVILDEVHAAPEPAQLVAGCLRQGIKVVVVSSAISRLDLDLPPEQIAHHRLSVMRNDEFAEGHAVPALRRLHFGGLPRALQATRFPETVFRSWHDTVLLRDLQWAYGSRDPQKLSRLLIHVLQHSGSCLAISSLSEAVGLSRPKVVEYLEILEQAGLVAMVYPYGVTSEKEAVEQRRVFAFDTGLICWARGWRREEQLDLDLLWRHLVLAHLRSSRPGHTIYFWRDAPTGCDLDFVVEVEDYVIAADCRWNGAGYGAGDFLVFNQQLGNRKSSNFLICSAPIHPAPANLRAARVVAHTPDIWGPAEAWTAPTRPTAPRGASASARVSALPGPVLGRRLPGMTVAELVWLLEQKPAHAPVHIGITATDRPTEAALLDIGSVALHLEGGARPLVVLADVDSHHATAEARRGRSNLSKIIDVVVPRQKLL